MKNPSIAGRLRTPHGIVAEPNVVARARAGERAATSRRAQ
jgi:hypothetical protein